MFSIGDYIIVQKNSFIEYDEFEFEPLEVLGIWEMSNAEPAYKTIGRDGDVYRLHSTIDIQLSKEYNKNRKREAKLKRILKK